MIYRVALENNENDDLETDIIAELDNGMSFYDVSHNGRLVGNDEVHWDSFEINEDEEHIVLLHVRINSDAADGETLRLHVRAGDGSDTETTRIDD